jgi:hypothetical protein
MVLAKLDLTKIRDWQPYKLSLSVSSRFALPRAIPGAETLVSLI